MLTLPIKKQWFDMIVNGEKKEEYREIKPYYRKRFEKLWQGSLVGGNARREIILRNGYSKKSPSVIAETTITIGTGLPQWGAEEGKAYFILNILSTRPLRAEE